MEKAKERLGSDARLQTPGYLISKLSFGFWAALCRRLYDVSRSEGPRLWPAILRTAFPFRPTWVEGRQQVYDRLEVVRELRNRAAHHEPLWDRHVVEQHSLVLDTLAWMNPPTARAVRALDRFPSMYAAGPLAFRREAETILIPSEH